MVLEFVKSGRNKDFLLAVHSACSHLEDLLKIDHPEMHDDDLASAISWPDALRHHIQMDADALIEWHGQIARLLTRFSLAKSELEALDPLDSSRLQSILNRAETSLASAIRNYPDLIKFQKEEDQRSPSFKGFVESIHRNLFEARMHVVKMEEIVARMSERQARKELHSEISDSRLSGSRVSGPGSQSSRIPGTGQSSALETSSLKVEMSSYLAKQIHHGEVPDHEFQTAVRKAIHFTELGNIPSVPWHGEPHCYGGAPEHLNGVVIGGQQRLVYYVQDSENRESGRSDNWESKRSYNNQSGRTVRLCCWISCAEHHDAFSRLRHQTIYRRIITNNRSIKITRRDFDGFTSS